MSNCLNVIITDPDPDYLGIEISAASERFCGATRIYASFGDLARFAESIAGFPASPRDVRRHRFGVKKKGIAGGCCALRFYCRDGTGHCAVEVELEDDDGHYSDASARFAVRFLPADLDRFVSELKRIENAQSGEAKLECRG